jgi:hypothetical protein
MHILSMILRSLLDCCCTHILRHAAPVHVPRSTKWLCIQHRTHLSTCTHTHTPPLQSNHHRPCDEQLHGLDADGSASDLNSCCTNCCNDANCKVCQFNPSSEWQRALARWHPHTVVDTTIIRRSHTHGVSDIAHGATRALLYALPLPVTHI